MDVPYPADRYARLFIFAAAVLIFLAAAAGAGIVAAHLNGGDEDLGRAIGLGDLVALLLGKDTLPFRQRIEPVGLGFVHIEEELFKVEVQGDFAVLRQGVQILYPIGKGGIGPVKVAYEGHGIHSHLLRKDLHRAGKGLIVGQKDLLVDLGLLIKIGVPILLIGGVALQVLCPCFPIAVQTQVFAPYRKYGLL